MKPFATYLVVSIIIASCSKERMPAPSPQIPHADNTIYQKVIYLDFNGGSLKNDSWNNGNEIQLQSSGMDESRQVDCLNRVALYFSLFQVTVTRDLNLYNSTLPANRQRVILTETSDWYSNKAETGTAIQASFGTETPCFVFTNSLYHDPINVSKMGAHEIGHTLNLFHLSDYDQNCNKTNEYSAGKIMGYSLSDNAGWSIGKSSLGCDSIQDDIHLITIRFKLKP